MPTHIIEEQLSVERLLRKYGSRVVVIRKDYTVFEASGHREETDNLITALQPYGID
jgi:acetolactate synthase-1/3 small subunit